MQGYQTPQLNADEQRRYWLARIHLKAQQMGLKGNTYRLTVLALAGTKTCESLGAGELQQLYYDLAEVAQNSGKEDNSAQALQSLLA